MVILNGKQTYMQKEELVSLLKSTPSGSVASIEVIQNPSAQYDAEGSGGIVNINMDRKRSEGLFFPLIMDYHIGIICVRIQNCLLTIRKIVSTFRQTIIMPLVIMIWIMVCTVSKMERIITVRPRTQTSVRLFRVIFQLNILLTIGIS